MWFGLKMVRKTVTELPVTSTGINRFGAWVITLTIICESLVSRSNTRVLDLESQKIQVVQHIVLFNVGHTLA